MTMITLYSGTPGSGKSLHLAELLYYRLKNRRGVVVCNFEVDLGRVSKKGRFKSEFVCIENHRLSPKVLERISWEYRKKRRGRVKEGELLLVVDECQLIFNARDWQSKGRMEWLAFFTQHRKAKYDIILVTQFDRMVDRQIRSLIEYEWIHRKVNNYGMIGKVLGLLSGGSLFVCTKMWYPMGERLGSEFFVGRGKFYKIYDTDKRFDMEQGEFPDAGGTDGGGRGSPLSVLAASVRWRAYNAGLNAAWSAWRLLGAA
jgi:hypothetical protein